MKEHMTRIVTWTAVIVLSMTLGAAAVVGVDSLRSESKTATVIERAVPSTSTGVATTTAEDIADLYARVRPSVVRIVGQSTRGSSALGSGVVLDKQGHILTNYHVVQGFDQLDVTFADGAAVRASVVGADPGNDLAVLKVDAPAGELTPAVLGDSLKVRVGELVIAVGNPFGIDGSVTQGIVSGVGRTLSASNGARPLRQLIQSDAAINPGNSGGALFNTRGEVIGITSAIENPSGERVFVGVGYAVPIETARRFLPDMLAGRTVSHPRLGVALQNVTPSLAARLGLNVDQGVLITSVEANTAAARAGLRGGDGSSRSSLGDVITAIDGTDVRSYDDLADYIDGKKVGDKVQLKISRDGKDTTADVTLEAWVSTRS